MKLQIKQIDTKFLHHPLTIAIIIVRVTFAFSMFISPVWGYVLTVIWDYLDATVLLHIEHISRKQYHYLDKNLDLVYFVVMLIISTQTSTFVPLFILFLFRMLGHYFFMRTHRVIYFVLFPNFFEVLYVFVILGNMVGITGSLSREVFVQWLIVLFLCKELHEIGLHYFWANHLKQRGIE